MTRIAALLTGFLLTAGLIPGVSADQELDARVQAFLDSAARSWHDLNVPAADYVDALNPKLTDDACLTAHNATGRGGTGDYCEQVPQVGDLETGIHPRSQAGVAMSRKRQ